MGKIRDLEGLKEVLSEVKEPVVGIAVSGFDRTGIGKYLPNYRIICTKNGRDLESLSKDFEITSIEKVTGEILPRRGPITILRNDISRKVLSKLKKPYLMFYMVKGTLEKICDENGWGVIGNRISIFTDDKIMFRRVKEKTGLRVIPGEISKITKLNYPKLSEKYGEEIVIQIPKGSGGRGTFFVRNPKDLEKAKDKIRKKVGETEVLITKFVEGPSISIVGCVTKHGILYGGLRYQLVDIPEVLNPAKSGVFCGNDWGYVKELPEKAKEQSYEYAEKVGEYLKGLGYKGIFGLDMVWDGENVYLIELNPRLIGCFPMLTMLQEINGEPLMTGFHVLEFVGKDYDLDLGKVNKELKKPKEGSQLILFNRILGSAKNRKSLKPGVYILDGNKLVYVREGCRYSDLKNKGEFVITSSIPFENTPLKTHERIGVLLTLERLMDPKTYKLNERTRKIVNKIYEELDIVPIEKC